MEQDSLNTETDLDSAAALPMPTAEDLGIHVTAGAVGPLTVGDTFDFPVTVSWSVQGSALLVMPTSTATAKGIAQVGVSQESLRSVKDGKEVASITFTYKLVAQDTGSLNIPALRFEIPTQMGQPLQMRSEPVPVRVSEQFNAVPFAVGLCVGACVAVAAVWRMRRRKAKAAEVAAKNSAAAELRTKMMVLKQRVNTADSREWLLELESICKESVADKFGMAASAVNLDTLVKDGKLEGWESLVEEFAHARYGGGKRDGFENKETWKGAMKLMGIVEDED